MQFNTKVNKKKFAAVLVNPFPPTQTPPPYKDLQNAFEAVAELARFQKINFIEINVNEYPELQEKLGVNFNLEEPPTNPSPESFPSTVVLFMNGMLMRSDNEPVQLKGYFVDRTGSAQPLITFIDNKLGSFLSDEEKSLSQEQEYVQQPTNTSTTYVTTYETPRYYGGYYPGVFYPLWWSLWWSPYYRYRAPYYGGYARNYYWKRPYGRGFTRRPVPRRSGVVQGRPIGRRTGVAQRRNYGSRMQSGFQGRQMRRVSTGQQFNRSFSRTGSFTSKKFGGMRSGGFRGGMRSGGFRGGGMRGGGRRR